MTQRRWLLGAVVLWVGCVCAEAQGVGGAFANALQGTQASGVVLDIRTGAVLARVGNARAATPGSVLKPILLAYALEHGVVREDTAVYCRRNLHVAGRDLACTHMADRPVFTAEPALAESCNTWFAAMARQMSNADLEAALQQAHLRHASMKAATVEQRELAVLGLEGVTVSTAELAAAYRGLLLRVADDGVVVRGLQESVDFGMASPAAVKGVAILGKTGTASNAGEAWTHGWFAGAVPGRFVVVVFVPHGDGGTAARLAQKFLAATSARVAR